MWYTLLHAICAGVKWINYIDKITDVTYYATDEIDTIYRILFIFVFVYVIFIYLNMIVEIRSVSMCSGIYRIWLNTINDAFLHRNLKCFT